MEIRFYKDSDEQGVMKLDEILETHPWNRRNLSNWKWKYKGSNPAGESIMVVATHNDDVVGFFAALPMTYWVIDKEVLGSHSIAMMIKPEWQNRGLIKFVADKVLAEVENRKFLFTYGYPNDNAYELHVQHLGYSDISDQKLYEKKLNKEQIELPITQGSNIEFRPIENFGDEINELWEQAKNNLTVALKRSPEFLNWRYIERPDHKYYCFGAYVNGKLCGYSVLKLYQEGEIQRGHIVDLFASQEDKDAGTFLVDQSLAFFNEKGMDEVNLWMQGSTFFQKILNGAGFEIVSTRPMICRLNPAGQDLKDVLTEENWYFTMGDTQEVY